MNDSDNKVFSGDNGADEAFGIDLGTTESVVACVRDGVPIAVPIDGGYAAPSVVNYAEKNAIVGRAAVSKDHQGSTVFSIKRFIGRDEKFCGRSPVEISADILFYLKKNAEKVVGRTVNSVVITVPAHFSDPQRMATRRAASIAGLKVLRLINEPTAAAIAFGLNRGNNGVFAVYDFGGGTFDFSVLRLVDGIFQVLATGGDNYLGGDDVDNAILDHNLRLYGLAADQERVSGRLVAKSLKECLGNAQEVTENYCCENEIYKFRLTQDLLQKVSADLIQGSLRIADQVLQDAHLDIRALDGVVLAGGMTKLRLVKDSVKEHFYGRFSGKIFDDVDPEKVVAFGAAIYADSIARKSRKVLLIDVVPLTLGIETLGGGVDRIIYRNTPIPIFERREYTTHVDNQVGVKFHIVQGESPVAAECRSLTHFELAGIPPMPARMPRVIVEFSVDVNGILSVKAWEQKTGLQQTVTMDPSSGLSMDDMTAMLQKTSSR
ncbi:MAG: Hsp70 family protein [Holosporaceae bacterium]|jgi:molecular chaperone HscA|nr:Hsp70 family protein [Holosporaceae bacterium]